MTVLKGAHAVLTGAGSGLGAAAAVLFAAEGARVVVSDRDAQAAERVAAAIVERGGSSTAIACDVTDGWSCARLVAEAENFFGAAIDVFHANAGIALSGGFVDLRTDAIEQTVAVNLTGAILSAQAAVPSLVRSGGSVLLFTASLQSVLGRPRRSVYTATKHAIVGLVKSLALELGPQGVRVNAVAPGSIDTPLLRQQLAAVSDDVPTAIRAIAERLPLQRMASEEDFAEAALYLVSRRSRAVTGQTLVVDCGAAAGFFD